MLSRFVARLLDENRTLEIESCQMKTLPDLRLPDEKHCRTFGIKPDEKYNRIFGIELRYSNSTAGALEHLDVYGDIGIQ
ncbi:hypothetical protein C1646_777912 [Rhizophagus diaphanus]|nr:hypothetical protein C1646_777912 [Rhizophagus diaphanus] [Rhizophagus sp. MUCL 43196]